MCIRDSFRRVKDKSAEGIQKCIEDEIYPIIMETPQKLIAQTYIGANVMSGAPGGVKSFIKKKYPYAHYIHCYAQQLNLLIQNAASQQRECFLIIYQQFPPFFQILQIGAIY